jgi:hypothetical protein
VGGEEVGRRCEVFSRASTNTKSGIDKRREQDMTGSEWRASFLTFWMFKWKRSKQEWACVTNDPTLPRYNEGTKKKRGRDEDCGSGSRNARHEDGVLSVRVWWFIIAVRFWSGGIDRRGRWKMMVSCCAKVRIEWKRERETDESG